MRTTGLDEVGEGLDHEADEAARDAAGAGDRKLTLALPAPVVRQLRARMAAEDTTVRALVLEALRRAGYAVPDEEIRDRRRSPVKA